MRNLSKHLRKPPLSQARPESEGLERTVALQNLSQQLLKVQDDERRRVARDLHDSTGQTLAALKMNLVALEGKLPPDECTASLLSEIEALADQALQEIRTTSYLLHPPLLDEAGFASAAQWFIEGFAKRSGVKVKLDLYTQSERMPIAVETALFRVLQEGLTNVHRHSGAKEICIRFLQQTEAVTLEIQDCGRGIPEDLLIRIRAASSGTGVGLAGMRERLNKLNGRLEIEADGRGTRLRAIVPLAAKYRSTAA
jgi:signal transduction histidine kinase